LHKKYLNGVYLLAFMLTLTQKKLLKLLAQNCRFTNKDIAKSLGVSQDTVEYQISVLFEKKKLAEFGALFNHRMLGFSEYHYLLRFKDIEKIPLEKLATLPYVAFMNTCFGGYDVQIIIDVKSEAQAQQCLLEIDKLTTGLVVDSLLFTSNYTYKYSTILPEFDVLVSIPKNKKQAIYAATTSNATNNFLLPYTLDDADKKIIYYLMKYPRKSYLQMSKHVDLSRELIRRRIEGYVKNKFLAALFIKPNYSAFGYYTNFMLLKLRNVSEQKLESYLLSKKEIFYAGRIVGTYTCIIYTITKNPDDFAELMRDIKITFKENLLDSQLFYFEKVLKQTQFPPPELLD
jgi:DNA-binding Lrp family transcriptional regulator